jgi:hypothetical protein
MELSPDLGLGAAAQLQRLACGGELLKEPLRGPVIRALELERKCRKWCVTGIAPAAEAAGRPDRHPA